MTVLEQYVSQVQTLSHEKNLLHLADYVRKSIQPILIANIQHLDTILPTLDLQQHSLGILGILFAKFNNEALIDGLVHMAQEFFTSFNAEQVRYMADIFTEMCHRYTAIMINKKEYRTAIVVLSNVILRLQTSPAQLTSIHPDLFQLCLLAQNFKPALKFLDIDITDIAKEHTVAFDAKYFLLYYYYGGMIYAALKNFNRALYFFEVVVSTPAQAISQIMVEAYKKYILICLILYGKPQPLPKYASPVVNRFIKPLCSSYVELSSAYLTQTSDKLRDAMNKHRDHFVRDNNVGLTKQVFNSLKKRNIQRLTKTFLTLSLVDVANRCHLSSAAEAEKYLVGMIEDGEIFASINQKDGMVYFHDNPEKYDGPGVLASINKELDNSFAIYRDVDKLDLELYLNPQYVQKIAKHSSASSMLHEDEGVSVGASGSGFSDIGLFVNPGNM